MAALLLAGTSLSFADTITNEVSYSPGFGIAPPNGIGQGIGREWGPGSVAWSATEGNPAGAVQINVVFDSSSDSPSTAFICKGEWGNPWNAQYPITVSDYDTLEFDIKYDTNSDITLDQYNGTTAWPASFTNSASGGSNVWDHGSWVGNWSQLYGGGYISGNEITFCGGPGGQMAPSFFTTNVPAAAAGEWAHVSIPVNKSQANIDGSAGIVFKKWAGATWALAYPVTARFYIDNVMFIGTTAPPPPPIVSAPNEKAQQGLNIWLASAGSLYDRQEVCSLVTNGLSWVGNATPANPVTYSFTVTGYPNSQNCILYMLLCANPAGMDNALDWNETNCVYVGLQGGPNNATMNFKYKVNEVSGQDMYNSNGVYTAAPGSGNPESGWLATLSPASGGVLGTWQVKFTSDTDGQIIAPDLTATSFTMPAYNAAMFAENPSAGRPGVYVYLGGQANNADAMSQAFVFSDFSVTGTPGAFTENFLAETVLDTTNKWARPGSAPYGTFIVPAADVGGLWLGWTLPASGYNLQMSDILTGGSLAWSSPASTVLGMVGFNKQLIAPSQLPAGNTAFFRLIKRSYTKLQILLPGETAAPNTTTGKTGTPTAQSANTAFNVIVNAVDNDWNVVSGVINTVHLTSTDGNFFVLNDPTDLPLSNGTATFSVEFLSSGSGTITATDITDGSKTPDTSPTITY